ncbi:MAG: DUF177 domain-containing protein [Coriobacteriia bacterium]|nr:DUF177 domain-containing protein [Coriobacteriia bacterium]
MSDLKLFVPEALDASAESASYSGELELPTYEQGGIEFRFPESLTWHLTITNTSEAFLVMGQVSGLGSCDCVRCLEEAPVAVEGDIEGYFVLPGHEPDEQDEDAEDYELFPADRTIDLEPLLLTAVSLSLPFNPVCSDDCKGLCSKCGENLNEGPCSCDPEDDVDETNPFAVLRNLSFED